MKRLGSRKQRLVVVAVALSGAGVLAATPSLAATAHGVGPRDPLQVQVPVTREAAPGIANETVYRPTDLRRGANLPVVIWGNGGCVHDNSGVAVFLTRIAAAGFFVVADGPASIPPAALPATASPALEPTTPTQPPVAAPPITTLPDGYQQIVTSSVAQEESVLNWIDSTNSDSQSPYYRALNTSEIATSGWSCGGIVGLAVAATDSRVKTVLGYDTASTVISSMTDPAREALEQIHVPVAYVMGGTSDIAYPPYQADWAMPTTNPTFEIENMYAGHTGFWQSVSSQTEIAQLGVDWMSFTLEHYQPGLRALTDGRDCVTCNQFWSTKEKNFSRFSAH